MTDPELGPLLQRFDVSARDQRSVARVRSAAAVACALCAVWLLLSRVPIPIFLAGLLGLVMSFAWLAQARRAARTGASAGAHHLSIHRDGLAVAEQNKLTRVRFADVSDIAVDEERLDVAVTLKDRRCIRIEPRYPGVEIHDLVRTLRKAMEAHPGARP
jgi:hypothetical protein